jgi:hypothetical protein
MWVRLGRFEDSGHRLTAMVIPDANTHEGGLSNGAEIFAKIPTFYFMNSNPYLIRR